MNAVVLVAGGFGRRLGGPVPKQYLELKGKPVIIHTLERFLSFDPGIKIILVMAKDHRKHWGEISTLYEAARLSELAEGGETRYDSVKNGLKLIPDGCIVGIHDAVRPLVSMETIQRCYNAASETGSGIPVIEMEESVRLVTASGSENLERAKLRRVQTPQVFKSELIREAYEQARNVSFTDDASVFERLHERLSLVEGNPENIKITKAGDLDLASLLI